jgi:hypothetical protein
MKDILEMNDSAANTKTISKHRELLSIVIEAKNPHIQFITEIDKQGDILFNVNLEDIGLTREVILKYHKEIFSNLFADFMGELLVRENIQDFASKLNKLEFDYYQEALSHKSHARFGMKIDKGFMVFRFHIALLQDILTEDFKIVS